MQDQLLRGRGRRGEREGDAREEGAMGKEEGDTFLPTFLFKNLVGYGLPPFPLLPHRLLFIV